MKETSIKNLNQHKMNPVLFGIVFGGAMIYLIVSTLTFKEKGKNRNYGR